MTLPVFCVNPTWVEHAKKGLEGSDVKVCTVVGFPLEQQLQL